MFRTNVEARTCKSFIRPGQKGSGLSTFGFINIAPYIDLKLININSTRSYSTIIENLKQIGRVGFALALGPHNGNNNIRRYMQTEIFVEPLRSGDLRVLCEIFVKIDIKEL